MNTLDIVPVPSIAYGSDSRSVYQGATPNYALRSGDISVVPGGMLFGDVCPKITKTGNQCTNSPQHEDVEGFCVAHRRQADAETRRIEKAAQNDGA